MRAFVLLLGATLAGAAVWKPLGPFGGSAEVIAVDPVNPDIIVAATKSGLVYRSTDKGESWSAADFPHAGSISVHALAVVHEKEPVFYLGVTAPSGEPGLYRSVDGAASWTPLPAFAGRPVYSLTSWKRDPRVIAAGSNDGVYWSSDRGSSWQRISGLPDQPITALAIDPERVDIVYAGTAHLPWKTSDGGKTWAPIPRGMPDDSDVFSFDIDPADPRRVFASACSGVYRSATGGEQWSRLTMIPDPSRRAYFVRIHPDDPTALFAGSNGGLWRSLDAGSTWQNISEAKVRSIEFHPSEAGTIYLATEGAGLLVSHDLGATARPLGTGFVSRGVRSISSADTSMFTTDGQYLSLRGSLSKWMAPHPPAGEAGRFSALLEMASGELLIDTGMALYRSSGARSSWTKLAPVSPSSRLRALKPIASRSRAILAGASDGLYLSDDLGDTWVSVIPGAPIDALFTGAASRGRVVARSSSRLLLSTDGARTWTPIEAPFGDGDLYDLDLDSDGVILAATARGLFRSADSGRTWSRPDGPVGTSTVKCVRFHPRRGVALALQGSEIHLSMDSGATWMRVESAELAAAPPRSIEVSTRAPDHIFALTQARGVFVSNLSEFVPRLKTADRK